MKESNQFKTLSPFRISYQDPSALNHCTHSLYQHLLQLPHGRKIVCVCIGTDRSTGDSLGPLVGSILQKKTFPDIAEVYGTLDEPVHALNLASTVEMIQQHHPDHYMIAIDACLGQLKNVGSIQVSQGSIKPGAGVNKDLPEVGNLSITGIVNVSGFMEYLVLQNTRLSLVMNMAEIIAESIKQSIHLVQDTSLDRAQPYV
ncbi:spore protease YyaC [Thermoactinomyces sp. DSM 45892]|uniref:spore protease YyaC n=1 Tax=Thermoactinomyces sp. DSM 45892 TaxID=1882753 RepID=UPI00089514D2|nr:spore protease YyaC [Thermoactinomyces sp. DSM 45892]SDY36848.1 putative sporulation protein YyaC [Thermoactinomyces sp. DSM 45892]